MHICLETVLLSVLAQYKIRIFGNNKDIFSSDMIQKVIIVYYTASLHS